MNREIKEPAGTIYAELGRRRMSVGRLATATGISISTLQRRLADPDTFELSEIAAIATVLEIPEGDLLAAWTTAAPSGDAA